MSGSPLPLAARLAKRGAPVDFEAGRIESHRQSRTSRHGVPPHEELALVAVAPASYGFVKDCEKCRRVYFKGRVTVDELKLAAVASFRGGKDYQASEITLRDQEGSIIRRQGQLDSFLEYSGTFEILCEVAPPGSVCVVVGSVMDDWPSELQIAPLAWQVPVNRISEHSSEVRHAPERIAPEDAAFIAAMVRQDSEAFSPVPAPAHRDDWAAKVKEAPQSLAELAASFATAAMRRHLPGTRQGQLCLLSLVEPGKRSPPMAALAEYVAAYFDTSVRLLPEQTMTPPGSVKDSGGTRKARAGKGGRARPATGRLFDCSIGWRDSCPANGAAIPQGQYDASDIHDALRRHKADHDASGNPPLRILAVTMADLFSGDDDLFTVGLADMRAVGVFSFARYHPDDVSEQRKLNGPQREAVLISRACKTAVHEICHLFNIGHCVYRHCCMNGSGHLREDFTIPHHLCPVCLAKLKWVFAEGMSLPRRAQKLLEFYRSHNGFDEDFRRLEHLLEKISV